MALTGRSFSCMSEETCEKPESRLLWRVFNMTLGIAGIQKRVQTTCTTQIVECLCGKLTGQGKNGGCPPWRWHKLCHFQIPKVCPSCACESWPFFRCFHTMGWQKTFSLSQRSKGCHLVTDEVYAHITPGIKDVKVRLVLFTWFGYSNTGSHLAQVGMLFLFMWV